MPVIFLLFLALAASSVSAQTISIISGNGLIVQESFPAPKPFRIRVTNSNGQGVASVAIAWSIKQGEGQLVNIGTLTDVEGYATAEVFGTRLLQGESYSTVIINASSQYGAVDFVANTVATRSIGGGFVGLPQIELIGPNSGNFSGPPGTVFPQAFGISVKAQAGLGIGQGIPYVGVRLVEPEDPTAPYARCNGPGNVVLTDAQGLAYCDMVLGNNQGFDLLTVNIGEISQFIRRIPVTITPGAACSMNVAPLTTGASAAGGSATLSITAATGTNCFWTAASNAPWITITQNGSGTGPATLTYSVAANTGAARTGTMTVAGRTVTINQAAAGSTGGPINFTTTSPLPAGVVGSQYSLQLGITGGTAPFQWTATGTFPPGLGLTPTNGFVSGVPTTAGTFAFTINVVDALGATASRAFSMTVAPASSGVLVITTASLPNGAVGVAYQQAVNATGACNSNPFGGGNVNWAVASGGLPTGTSLAPSGASVLITGTPTTQGAYNFTLRATSNDGSCSRSAEKAFTITISNTVTENPMTVTPVNVEFSVALTAPSSAEQPIQISTGATAVTFTASTATPWLRITPTTGTTPLSITAQAINIASFQAGVYNGSITITSGASNSPVTIPVTLRVAAPPNITVGPESLLFRHTLQTPISQQIFTVGSPVLGTRFFMTVSTESGGQWLSVSPVNGETPATIATTVNTTGLAPGTYSGAVRVIPDGNAGGAKTVPVTVVVSPASTLTVNPNALTFEGPGSQTITVGSTGTPIPFTAVATGGPWLSITSNSGSSPANILVNVNVVGLSPGTYRGSVIITPGNSSEAITVPVTVNVSQGQPVITAVTNAASFAPGSIVPGELVTIFGTSIGPPSLTSGEFDATGTLPTTLSNVRVLFDNVAAPLIYVSSNQVSTIVPFGVFGRTSVRVQVINGPLQSNTFTAQIADTAPGIFVLDASGQGAILNQDNTVNAQLNGAQPGSIIAIYATGGGQMDRQVFDGRLVTDTPYPRPLLPVGVRIGGRFADVTYFGAAPGQVAGMLQVNARVPADTPTGTTVPIQITIGSATSQANVFLATRP